MQICFDIFYDDEFEEILGDMEINHKVSIFLVGIPDLFLIIDTFLKFFTGFYEDGVVIVEKSAIAAHYFKKGLIFDLLSYFPVIIQGIMRKSYPEFFDGHEFVIKLAQLLMFFKVKRVKMALSNFEEIIASRGGHDNILRVLRLVFVNFFIAHINACIWHAVAYFPPFSKDTVTWLDESNLKEEYWLVKYLNSIFWAISMMSTINYNKISPQNNFELLIASFILVVSVFLFGYSIISMKQILDILSKNENEYKFYYYLFNILKVFILGRILELSMVI